MIYCRSLDLLTQSSSLSGWSAGATSRSRRDILLSLHPLFCGLIPTIRQTDVYLLARIWLYREFSFIYCCALFYSRSILHMHYVFVVLYLTMFSLILFCILLFSRDVISRIQSVLYLWVYSIILINKFRSSRNKFVFLFRKLTHSRTYHLPFFLTYQSCTVLYICK